MRNVELTPKEQLWLLKKWKALRQANINADTASNDWNRTNMRMKDLIERQPGMDHTDPAAIARIKAPNLMLADAMARFEFFRRDADRHANDIQAFYAMKKMGVLKVSVG